MKIWSEYVSATVLATTCLMGMVQAETTVEVLHCWTSGGESHAKNTFAAALNKASGQV